MAMCPLDHGAASRSPPSPGHSQTLRLAVWDQRRTVHARRSHLEVARNANCANLHALRRSSMTNSSMREKQICPPPVQRNPHAQATAHLSHRITLRGRVILTEQLREVGQRLEGAQDLEH
eukprot:10481915-Alexandrium_andersonii.AAC.1